MKAKNSPSNNEQNHCFLYSLNLSYPEKSKNDDTVLNLGEYGVFCVIHGIGENTEKRKVSEEIFGTIKNHCWSTSLKGCKVVSFIIREAISQANIRIKKFSKMHDIEEIGATLAVLYLNPMEQSSFIIHVGNCCVYRMRSGTLEKLTSDHVKSEEGQSDMTGEITRAVGLFDKLDLEMTPVDFQAKDLFFLCSRGLNPLAHDEKFIKRLQHYVLGDVEVIGKTVVDQLKANSWKKDISVVLIKVVDEASNEKKGGLGFLKKLLHLR